MLVNELARVKSADYEAVYVVRCTRHKQLNSGKYFEETQDVCGVRDICIVTSTTRLRNDLSRVRCIRYEDESIKQEI